jgi:hypothetical protein
MFNVKERARLSYRWKDAPYDDELCFLNPPVMSPEEDNPSQNILDAAGAAHLDITDGIGDQILDRVVVVAAAVSLLKVDRDCSHSSMTFWISCDSSKHCP